MIYRDDYLNTMLFGNPEKIPFVPGYPRKSTIERWQAEGLPKAVDWEIYLYEKLCIEMPAPKPCPAFSVDFRMNPWFEEKVLEHKNGHYIIQDWMGAILQISDQYDYTYIRNAIDFVTRSWIKSPVETREDWAKMKERYSSGDSGRVTSLSEAQIIQINQRDSYLNLPINGPFWQLREWMGFENLCIAMAEDAPFVEEMITFWQDFVLQVLRKADIKKVNFDSVLIQEDMAYKAHSMISPEMTQHFLVPVYKKWISFFKSQGIKVIRMDSDGYIAELLPIWIESGFNATDPVEVAAHNDIVQYRETYGDKIAFYGGVDKRAIAAGGKTIEDELKRVCSLLGTGGYIPSCDHGVPHDISLENFIYYSRLLAKYTGWL